MADELPTADEFFGASQTGAPKDVLPTADEFFAQKPQARPQPSSASASSSILDRYMAASPTGKILSAFGQGVQEGWGAGPVGIKPGSPLEKQFQDAGLLPGIEKSNTDLIKAFNESIIRPAAAGVDAVFRGVGAIARGVEGAVAKAGDLSGAPGIGHEAAGMIEWMMTGTAHTGVPRPRTPVELERARSLGVIGEGEEGWRGAPQPKEETAPKTEAPKENTAAAPHDVIAPESVTPHTGMTVESYVDDYIAGRGRGSAEHEQFAANNATAVEAEFQRRRGAGEKVPESDTIHKVARAIAPDTFREYDALQTRAETFRRWLSELQEKRNTEAPEAREIAELREKIEGGATPRLTKKYEARIGALERRLEEQAEDTPDMKRVRDALQQTDYRMRDLSPDVSEAYRQAKEQMPKPEAPPIEGPRHPFPEDFPSVVIQQGASSKLRLTEEPDFWPAKTGDATAAARLVEIALDERRMADLQRLIGERKPELVSVHKPAVGGGHNQIPLAYAEALGHRLGLEVDAGIVQARGRGKTGAKAADRVGSHRTFAGDVKPGQEYLLVDDTITQGGTLADLRNYIERGGGKVIGATALMGARASNRLQASKHALDALRSKIPELDEYWKDTHGYGLEGLTASEIHYLRGFGSIDAIRDRLSTAAQGGEPDLAAPAAEGAREPANTGNIGQKEPVSRETTPEAPPAAEPAKGGESGTAAPTRPPVENIAQDVAQRLVDAGRPQPEAEAAGALIAAHYAARAARFDGAKGTAAELYAAEGPRIVGEGAPRQKGELEFAQSVLPPELVKIGQEHGFESRRFIEAEAEWVKSSEGMEYPEGDAMMQTPGITAGGLARDKPGFVPDLARQLQDEAGQRPQQLASQEAYIRAATTQKFPANVNRFEAIRDQSTREYAQAAYHGSPFHFDQFTTEHIGKGEGAQAYGWGLYFAGEKKVAEFYRQMIKDATASPLRFFKGEPVDRETPAYHAGTLLETTGKTLAGVRKEVEGWIKNAKPGEDVEHYRGVLDALNKADKKSDFTRKADPGRVYHVEIVPTDAELLAWDKPLADQPPKVKEALAKFGITEPPKPELPKDPEIAAIVAKAIKAADGEPWEVELTVDNDRALYERAVAHAEKNGIKNVAENPGVGAYVTQEAIDYLRAIDKAQKTTGEQIYKQLTSGTNLPASDVWNSVPWTRNPAERASKALLSQGVRGIRYLDEGSRPAGEGTHNYVIFDGADAVIKEYEQPARGKITFKNDQATIKLMNKADASTFIHETGHNWLEELERDARDPAAPDDLIQDSRVVRDWLGAEDGKPITRRQHEKFARGFERYMMEGRAPTRELAGVFQQFKNWLTSIYQTVKALRSPITDDIRAVFDRMLTKPEREAVITPEREADTFATRHEGQVEATPVEQAATVADQMRTERDEAAADIPEIDRERRTHRGSPEDRTDQTGGEVPDGGGDAGQPAAIDAGAGEGSGTQRAGGARSKAEGREEPRSPSDVIPAAETEYIDKAGNIRLENLTGDEDIRAIIRQAAEQNEGFIGARRGVLSDAQVLDLADALGMDAAKLSRRKIGQAFNAEEVAAARQLLIQSAVSTRAAMAKAASGGEAELMAYAQARQTHLMIQSQVSGITAEAGRALRAFRDISGLEDARALSEFFQSQIGKSAEDLHREAVYGQSLQTPQQVSKFMQDSRRATFSEMIQEFWINALLSGPMTHVKNIIGNAGVAVNRIVEVAGAAGVGKIREALGNEGERVYIGEAKASLFGLAKGTQDGLIAAKYAFQHEEQFTQHQTIEQRKYQAIPSKRIVLERFEQGTPEFNERLTNVATARARAEFLTGEALDRRVAELTAKPTPDLINSASERVVEIGGKQIRLPGRMLTAEDQVFKTIAYRQRINEMAYHEALKDGLKGDAFNERIADRTMNPTDAMMEEARKFGDYQTFTNDLGRVGQALQRLSNASIFTKMILTFVRTPLNIAKYAAERSPLGFAFQAVRDNLSGMNGKLAQDTQIARMAIGTSIGVYAIYAGLDGMATGGGPSKPEEKAAMMLTGWRPYSVRFGDMYYSYNWFDPFATTVGVGADIGETFRAMGHDDADMAKVMGNFMSSITTNMLSKASLKGTSDFVQAVVERDRFGGRYIQGLVGSLIPSSIGQMARSGDPYQREIHSVLDSLKSRIPGQREDLLPERDVWGQPIEVHNFGPVAMARVNNDPVNRELLRLGIFPSKVERKIRGVELTDQQFDDYARMAGKLAKARLDPMVNMQGWDAVPEAGRREAITKVISSSREVARNAVMMQSVGTENDIVKKASEDRLRKLTTTTPSAYGP